MSQQPATSDRPRLSGLAVAGLLFGLTAPALITGPLALYFSYRGLYDVNASDGKLVGRTAAIIGLLLGGLASIAGIIGTFALIIATMQTADARVSCENNLRAIGVAEHQYYNTHGNVFPRAVVPLKGEPPEKRASWLAAILPYLELRANRETKWQSLSGRLDLDKTWDDPANREALTFFVPYYQCMGNPAFDPRNHPGITTYVGVAGVGDDAASLPKGNPRAGFFGYERDVTLDDVRVNSNDERIKGTSYKMMVLETASHNGDWIAGGPPTVRGVGFDAKFLDFQGATLVGLLAAPEDDFGASLGAVLLVPRPAEESQIGPGRAFGGMHQGGLNVLWADGSVRFVTENINPHTFRMQASLSDDPAALDVLP